MEVPNYHPTTEKKTTANKQKKTTHICLIMKIYMASEKTKFSN